MKKIVLDNGIKFLYEYKEGDLTSFCIGFNGGAIEEEGFPKGTAHAAEHLVFKETQKRKEIEINRLCDDIFAFNNAMTNYPYVIYYGTSLMDDFERGIELYSDIVREPLLSKNGFDEEMCVIKQELKDWKDDISLFCEDELLYNSFDRRRIKYPIIGTDESIKDIDNDTVRLFYDKFYAPSNCVISVVSSMCFDEVYRCIDKYFGTWHKDFGGLKETFYEMNNSGIYECRRNTEGAKIQILYPIHYLSDDEITALQLFNTAFGEGTSSILYDEVRTKKGLVYDISSSVKNERGIKFLSVNAGTSLDKIDTVLNIIKENIDSIEKLRDDFSKNNIIKLYKRMNRKKSLSAEKSIILSNMSATYELMYGDGEKFYNEYNFKESMDSDKIINTAVKVLKEPSIEIIKP